MQHSTQSPPEQPQANASAGGQAEIAPFAFPPPPQTPISGGAALANLLEPASESLPETPPDPQATTDQRASPPPVVFGYEILEVLGRGGMGVVYKARQLGLNRLVALKMIRTGAGASAEELARFRAEAEAVARLHHPNIIQVHEIGLADGQPYLTLEFVAGGSLAQRLASAPLPARQAAELTETLAHALQAAHQQGIIHRDLKPANILLQKQSTTDRTDDTDQNRTRTSASVSSELSVVDLVPKISDFGLAKLLGQETGQTQTGAILGTPAYAAPEQALGKHSEVGPATDVYALGAVLYEMLTGRPPFRGATPLETLDQVRTREPVPPRQLQPGVPRDLETICLRCLHKDRCRRYPSALALAQDLRRFLDGAPILARPVSLGERAWKWARRQPVVAALAGCSSTLAVALLGIGLVYHFRLQNALLVAEKQRLRAETNSRKMLEAAEGLLTEVGVEDLEDVNAMDEVRVRLLEKALRFYEGLPAQPEDSNRAIRRQTARVLTWTAAINSNLNQLDRAEADIRQAVARCRQLAADFPDEVTQQRDLAFALTVQGDVCETRGKPAEAEDVRRQAKTLLESLPLDQSATRFNLANVCHRLGRTCPRQEESRLLFQQALDLIEKPTPEGPTARSALHLSAICVNFGVLHLKQGQTDKAEAFFQKARTAGEIAVRGERGSCMGSCHLADAYHNLAAISWARQRNEEAEELYGKALKLRQQLVRAHPNALAYLHSLLSSHETLADFCQRHRGPALEEHHLREAIALLKPLARPGQPHALSPTRLARIYLALGHPLWLQGKSEEAQASIQQAITLLEDAKRQGPLEHAGPAILQQAYQLRSLFWLQKLQKWLDPEPDSPGKGK